LKYTLVTLAASLFVCVVLFINIEGGQKGSYTPFEEAGGRAIPGVYNDDSARSFEPDAFCGEPAPPESWGIFFLIMELWSIKSVVNTCIVLYRFRSIFYIPLLYSFFTCFSMSAIITVKGHIFPSEPNVTTSNLYRCSDTKFYYPFSWNMHAIRIYREPGCPEVEQSRPCTGQDHSSFCTCNTKKSHSYIYIYIYTVPDSQQSHSHRCKRRKQAFAQANKYQTVGRIFGGNF